MNKKRKTNLQEKGITLVALVVTIIVLLILAGVTISLALGSNGIIGRAQYASNSWANATMDEKTAMEEMTNEVARLSRRGDNGEGGGSGGGGGQTGTATEMKDATSNATIFKTESATGTVTPLSTTGTTTVKDNKNNEIKVPKNFGIAYDSGDNVADGVVIEDTSHNQYVWIPVGTITNSSGASKTIDLIRSNFNGITTSNAETVIDDYYYEYNETSGASYENTKAKNISEFVSSANTNHGYYLARYEAGIDANQDQYNYASCSGYGNSMTYGDQNKMIKKDGSVKPLSKAGVGVWNAVTQLEAATICRAMYTKTADGVESDLINSFAWDTAIDFIQKCGTESNSSSYATTDGTSAIDTSKPQTTGTNKLSATNAVDQQCKIFDMAGNCLELCTETSTYIQWERPL